jgi:hypothetical protein
MKKIRLDLEALAVETFATTKDGGNKWGTVRGHGSGIGCATNTEPYDPSVSADGNCVCEQQIFTGGQPGCAG